MLEAFCFATQLFHLKCTDREFNPDPKTLDGFALMALLTLTSTLVGWYNLRLSARWKKTTLRH